MINPTSLEIKLQLTKLHKFLSFFFSLTDHFFAATNYFFLAKQKKGRLIAGCCIQGLKKVLSGWPGLFDFPSRKVTFHALILAQMADGFS